MLEKLISCATAVIWRTLQLTKRPLMTAKFTHKNEMLDTFEGLLRAAKKKNNSTQKQWHCAGAACRTPRPWPVTRAVPWARCSCRVTSTACPSARAAPRRGRLADYVHQAAGRSGPPASTAGCADRRRTRALYETGGTWPDGGKGSRLDVDTIQWQCQAEELTGHGFLLKSLLRGHSRRHLGHQEIPLLHRRE